MATLSIYDPISKGYINLDGGVASANSLRYQILVELRILNAQMQSLVNPTEDETQNLRADQSVAEPNFSSVR